MELTAYPGETFHGRVTRIADTVDPQTRTIKVRAEMDNAHGKLRPEMYGTIRHTDSMRTLPVVPAGAVLQGDGKTSVWVETVARAVSAGGGQGGRACRRDAAGAERLEGGNAHRGGRRDAAAGPIGNP